jgi:hypothetical protein
MKEPSERGQGVKPPYKRGKQLKMLIVRAGIASSGREAQEMLAANEICVLHTFSETWRHGTGKPTNESPSTLGTVLLDENTQVVHRSKCPECRNKPIVFAKRDRKPASSSATHSRVLDGGGCDDCERPRHEDLFSLYSSDPRLIPQDLLLEWFRRRQELSEVEEAIAVALSKGAVVEEYAVHTAELLPTRNEDGSVHLKLVIR